MKTTVKQFGEEKKKWGLQYVKSEMLIKHPNGDSEWAAGFTKPEFQ